MIKRIWVLVAILAIAGYASAQQQANVKILVNGAPVSTSNRLPTTCDNCGGGSSITDGDGTANQTAPAMLVFGHAFNGTTWDRIRGDATNGVWVNLKAAVVQHIICDSGCGTAAAVAMADSTANPTIPQTAAFGMVWNTATWDRLRGDSTNGMWVNLKSSIVQHIVCDSGCGTAASVLMADATSNPTIPQTAAFGMVWNTSTWDRLRGDTTNGAWVNIKSSVNLGRSWTLSSGTDSVTASVTFPTTYPPSTTAALADNMANPTIGSAAAFNMVFDGVQWDRLPGDSTNGAFVQIKAGSIANTGFNVNNSPTVNQGTANTAANAWPTKLTDGTNTAAVKAAATAAAAADPSAVVALSPNSPIPTGSNTIGAISNSSFGVTNWLGSVAPTVGQKTSANSLPTVIASDQSAIPENLTQIGGSALTGKAVPSGGAGQTAIPVYSNAVQLATYTIVADSIASGALTANTRKDVLSIEHGAGATKTVKIRRIQVGGFQTTALVGTVYCKIFRGTAATSAGTGQTPTPTNPGTAAAEMVAKTLPTITAATLVYTNSVGFISAATAQTGFPMIAVYDWQEEGETQPLQLRAANLDTLVIAIYSNVAHNLTLQISVIATEE
jgi:hypothetical protein